MAEDDYVDGADSAYLMREIEPREPFTVKSLGIVAVSHDPEDSRILRLHFDHDVTNRSSETLIEALNFAQASGFQKAETP